MNLIETMHDAAQRSGEVQILWVMPDGAWVPQTVDLSVLDPRVDACLVGAVVIETLRRQLVADRIERGELAT